MFDRAAAARPILECPMAETHRYDFAISIAAAAEPTGPEAEKLRGGIETAARGVLEEDAEVVAELVSSRKVALHVETSREIGSDEAAALSGAIQDVVVDALEPGDGMTVGRLEAVEDDAAPKP